MKSPCLEITKNIGNLFVCSEFKDFIQITTPLTFPDGDIIEIFYRRVEDGFVLTDLGETIRWLESQSMTGERNEKQDQLIQEICLGNNLKLKKNMLIKLCNSDDNLADKIFGLGQVILEIAGLWTLQRK